MNKSLDEIEDNKEKELNPKKHDKYKICNNSGQGFETELKTIKKILSARGAVPNNDILFH